MELAIGGLLHLRFFGFEVAVPVGACLRGSGERLCMRLTCWCLLLVSWSMQKTALNPKLLNPTSQTLHPKPQTLNPNSIYLFQDSNGAIGDVQQPNLESSRPSNPQSPSAP